ncbi:MAG: hypothetical protein NTX53_04110 [candidate division WOR-3 bacterium]|nr:hypothetical protein [candidate division WOR-3 bacterium]
MKSQFVLLTVCCLLSAVSAQSWDGPHQLTFNSSDDINPSACKEFLPGHTTCLVWQRMTAENWDIFSRFSDGGWTPEAAVTTDSVDDVNPAVACLNDWQDGPSYWCVWEHRVSRLVGSIRASLITFGDSWGPPVDLGPTIHTDGDSAMPGIITIKGASADTVWVAWRNHDTSGTYITCAFRAGDSWSSPEIAVMGDLRHARLGRSLAQYYAKPMLVWELAGDIWYSIRDSSGWRTPAQVAPSAYEDHDPDIVSGGGMIECGTYVVWQSTRDGDTAVYITEQDSFSVGQRACEDSAAGRNFSPVGADFARTTLDYWMCVVAWVSDRNGNPDIYTSEYRDWDVWVDLDSADDIAPVVTCMGDWGSQMAWVLWQSDRTGNWDIFGSFVYNSGVQETPNAEVRVASREAAVVRGLPAGATVFDASGRRVVNPKSGIYFVRPEPSAASRQPSAVTVRKVILQR